MWAAPFRSLSNTKSIVIFISPLLIPRSDEEKQHLALSLCVKDISRIKKVKAVYACSVGACGDVPSCGHKGSAWLLAWSGAADVQVSSVRCLENCCSVLNQVIVVLLRLYGINRATNGVPEAVFIVL